MSKIEAREVVAYGYECDNCHQVTVKESRHKENRRYFIKPNSFQRVTDFGHSSTNIEELYFCSKDCLINWVTFGISNTLIQISSYNRGKFTIKN